LLMNGGKLMNNIIEIKNLNRCYKKGWLKTQKVERISNLNRLSTKFQKYADKEFIDKKSRATACRF
jgi:hypothetical protein